MTFENSYWTPRSQLPPSTARTHIERMEAMLLSRDGELIRRSKGTYSIPSLSQTSLRKQLSFISKLQNTKEARASLEAELVRSGEHICLLTVCPCPGVYHEPPLPLESGNIWVMGSTCPLTESLPEPHDALGIYKDLKMF